MNTEAFANCMKRHMEKKNISLQDLSKLTGIPIPRLEEYESGTFKARSSEIIAIGHALEVPPMLLMKGGGTVHYSMRDENGHRICKSETY